MTKNIRDRKKKKVLTTYGYTLQPRLVEKLLSRPVSKNIVALLEKLLP